MRKIRPELLTIIASCLINSFLINDCQLRNILAHVGHTVSHLISGNDPNLMPLTDPALDGSLTVGTPITLSTSVINSGSADAGPFANHFYIDLHSDGYDPSTDIVLGQSVAGLSVDSTVNFTKSWIAVEGTHLVRVLVDGTNTVAEAIESDNSSAWISFTVLASGPNLKPVDLPTLDGPQIEGTQITFSTSVVNNGSADAGPFANHIYIDLDSDGYDPSTDIVFGQNVASLAADSLVSYTKTWTAIEGTHQVRVLADGLNSISESIENDNFSEWVSFTVSAVPEFGLYGNAWRDYILNTSQSMNSIIYQFADNRFVTVEERVQQVFELLNNGKHVIINLALKDRDKLYFTTEDYIDRVNAILQNADIVSLNQNLDFTFGEENSINSIVNPTVINGFSSIYTYLEYLHDTLSVSYPNHNFKQWYSPRCQLIHQFEEDAAGYDELRTPNIHNDGWVYDHYNFGSDDYNTITDLYANDNIQNNTKTSSVIWLSPDWIMLNSDDVNCDNFHGTDPNVLYSQFTWWNEIGWRYFYNNVAKNIERNIPSYFFMFTKTTTNGLVKPLHDPSAKQCHYDFVNYIETVTVPYMTSHSIPLEVPDLRPSWIPEFDFNSCGCEENVLLSNQIYSATYQVSNHITSNGYLPANTTVYFKANTIGLDPDFEVHMGTVFSAEISPCQ